MKRPVGSLGAGASIFVLGVAALVALAGLSRVQAQRVAATRRAPPGPPVVGTAAPRVQADAPPTRLSRSRAAAFVEANARRLSYVPGEVLVKFKKGASRGQQQRALSALASRPSVDGLRWIGDVALLTDPSQPDAFSLSQRLSAQPDVQFAQPNYIRRAPGARSDRSFPVRLGASPAGIPNDPDYADLQWNLSLINMPGAWDITPGGSPAITVAVIDTGVTTETREFNAPLWTGSGFETVPIRFAVSPDLTPTRFRLPRDFTFDDPLAPVRDLMGHGTHVASTIAEDANNGLGVAGIAYRVRLMPVKVCFGYWELMLSLGETGTSGFVPTTAGGCSSADIADGIRYAVDNGARVINVSISGSFPSQVERDALVYAAQQGAFVAVAAGNSFEEGNPPQYPAAFASSIDGVMSVAAIGKSQTRAHYSTTGTFIEVAAPGGSVRDGGGDDGGAIWQVTLLPADSAPAILRPRFDRYVEVGYTGTSMAAPHVSGVAALLMSQGVTNPRAIEAFIKATAKDLGPKGTDTQFGYGLLQGRAAVFGFGIR